MANNSLGRQKIPRRAKTSTSPGARRGFLSGSFTKKVSYQELVFQTDKAVLLRMRGKEIWFPRLTIPYIDTANKRVTVYKDFLKMKLKEARLTEDAMQELAIATNKGPQK